MNHQNTKDHTFIVGDIHGCFNELMLLLKQAQCSVSHHRIILVGDVINKGPDSLKTLNWIYQNKIESVIGNHELAFIESIENGTPMSSSLQQLKEEMNTQIFHWIQFLKSWPTYIEEKDFMVVHAGLVPNEHPSCSKIEHLVNLRFWDIKNQTRSNSSQNKPWHDYYHDQKLVIYGHWARQGFLQKKNSIGLDSGCVYGNQLTGIWLPSRTIIQVPSSYSA